MVASRRSSHAGAEEPSRHCHERTLAEAHWTAISKQVLCRSPAHHADLPCDLELISRLLMQLKGAVKICVADQITVGAVIDLRCEHPPEYGDGLDVLPGAVGGHAVIMDAGNNAISEAAQ